MDTHMITHSSVGVAVLSGTSVCLAINNSHLSNGSPVSLVVASPPQSLVQAEVVGPAAETCNTPQLHDSGSNIYELRLRSGSLPPVMPVIAVTDSSRPLRETGGIVSGDLGGNGGREFFRLCNSTEGIHLTVWSGKPLTGRTKMAQVLLLRLRYGAQLHIERHRRRCRRS